MVLILRNLESVDILITILIYFYKIIEFFENSEIVNLKSSSAEDTAIIKIVCGPNQVKEYYLVR